MRKILTSFLTIGVVALVAFGATQAFFSDTETSTGNVLQAGAIDLKIDSDCHYFEFQGLNLQNLPIYRDVGCFHEVLGTDNEPQRVSFGTWSETDLTTEQFFWFEDLKPGDWGEHTISLHVLDNDAWGRMFLANVKDDDNTCTEPENKALGGENGSCAPGQDGELDNFMSAFVWLDQGGVPGFQCSTEDQGRVARCNADPREGDNVWQRETEPIISDSISNDFSLPFAGLLSSAFDSFFDITSDVEAANAVGLYADGRMKGSITYYIGVAWCFGEGDITLFGTPAFFCDGSNVDNTPQTDLLAGDVGFEVEQHRNNPNPF